MVDGEKGFAFHQGIELLDGRRLGGDTLSLTLHVLDRNDGRDIAEIAGLSAHR